MAGTTSDGYMWSREEGLQHGGFACEGVVSPPQKLQLPRGTTYDVVIVGGGYAGLAAARDLTVAGAFQNIYVVTVVDNRAQDAPYFSLKAAIALVAAPTRLSIKVTQT